jgi:hypothetical protein
MIIVGGMCDWSTATATAIVTVWLLWLLWLLSGVVIVVKSIVLDRCTECVLEDLGQDIFHVYWDITEGFFRMNREMTMTMGKFRDGWMGTGNGKRTRK